MSEWLFILQLQISLAVIVILLLRLAMKKLPKVYSYLLWLLMFVRLLVPVTVESRFSFMPSEQEQDAFMEQILVSVTGAEDSAVFGKDVEGNPTGNLNASIEENPGGAQTGITSNNQPNHEEVPDGQFGNWDATEGISGESSYDSTVGAVGNEGAPDSTGAYGSGTDDTVTMSGNTNTFPAWPFIILWVLGSVAVLGYNGISMQKVRRQLKSARFLLDQIEIGAGSAPVYECEGIQTPFTLGILKPEIFLPTGLAEEELKYILCHERVHISRKDNLLKNLAFLLTAVYWFNPFVWVAFFLMERDMEMSCDEKVIKLMGKDIKRNYSQSLLDFAARPKKMLATHLTFGENSVKQRVKNVLSYKNAKKWTVGIGAAVLVVVVVALFTTGGDESVQVDDWGDQVMADGQGSVVQGNDGFDDLSNSILYVAAYLHATPQLALDDWKNRYATQNENIVYSEYDYDENTDKAVIRYIVADGWKRYVIQEAVKVVATGSDDLYYVEQESLTDYHIIETNDQFEALYGIPGLRDLNLLGYDASYYRRILQQFHENGADVEYCARFTDPVTAAVEMLNLGEGSGVAKLKDGTVISEGTYAYVTYTFAKDGSTVELPMRLIEGSYGLWSVDANAVREATTVLDVGGFSTEQRFGFVLEVSQYGIYRNTDGVLTNIYPYYISTDRNRDEADGIFYFATDTTYQEGDTDYKENMICMLDLVTGEIDKETLSLESLPLQSAGALRGVGVYNGFVSIAWENMHYYMPLVNTGNTPLATGYTYNGKAVKDLTAAEQNAYSMELRNEILKGGEVVKLSNRTRSETYAYVDLDGDGKAEKIVLSEDTSAGNYPYKRYPYDSFRLQVGDSMVTGQTEYLKNELWFFSYDGENIVIMLFAYGGGNNSGTVAAKMYLYKDGELCSVGDMHCYVSDIVPDVDEGVFYVWEDYNDFIQPVSLKRAWKINEWNQLERVAQETYDISYDKQDLPDPMIPLPVYETPGGGEVTYIQPQKVDFIKVDSTFQWVYVQAADGSRGWCPVDGGLRMRIDGLDLYYWEVFAYYNAPG